jgi:carboxypeptidase Taq
MPFQNKIIRSILDYYKNLWALSYVSGVAHWDLETYMPPVGAGARGEALGRLSVIRQKMFLDPSFTTLLHKAYGIKQLTDAEKGVVRVLLRSLKFYEKVPANFIEEFEKLTNNATVIWREAKAKDDFSLFESSLSKIFDMNRKMADYLGYKDSPYDALLDQYEENLTVKTVEPFFAEIKEPLKNILSKTLSSPKYLKDDPLEFAKYDKSKMVLLNEKVLKTFWPEYQKNFRLDISSHPFTTSFSNTDTRITTWYHDTDFARSLLAVIHEFGHALYDLQCDPALEMTPIQGGSSLVIHESQSRFWENFIGRSESFIEEFLPDIQDLLSEDVQGTTLYRYLNKVSPSLLRVEADEVTYHFHIMLRYEIEKGLIESKYKVKDVREIWNSKMKEYLGVVPTKDSEGALQDIHWSGGMVGYFPTYSLGTFLSAQWAERINNSQLTIYNFEQTKKWLKENIHQYGSTYTLGDLLKKNKIEFDPKINLDYLQEKYSKIYNF